MFCSELVNKAIDIAYKAIKDKKALEYLTGQELR